MTAQDFIDWLELMGFNDSEATRALGLGSRNTLVGYKSAGAPQYVALACSALAAGLPGWTNPKSRPIEGNPTYVVKHIAEDRSRNILISEIMPYGFRSEEEVTEYVIRQQAPFAHKGFDGMSARWWARNDEVEFRLHYWWKQSPIVGDASA